MYKILQITDTHIFKKSDCKLSNVSPNEHLTKIKNFIVDNNIYFDFMLLTGDISQDKTEASYLFVANTLSGFEKTIYWIPGNHDNPSIARAVFDTYPFFKSPKSYVPLNMNWAFLFVDSVVPGEDHGFINERSMSAINKAIEAYRDKSLAFIMHHHAIPVGTPLIDKFMIKNSKAFLDNIEQSGREFLIICGHVHEGYEIKKNHIKQISSPATCFQFVKGTPEMSVDPHGGFMLWAFGDGKFSYRHYYV